MTTKATRQLGRLFPALLLLLVGCGQEVPPQVTAIREFILLTEEPSDATSIQDAKEATTATSAISPQAVTLVGQIDAGDFDPFDRTQAAFALSELPDETHQAAGHDPSTCPFCKRKAAAATTAYVTLRDDKRSKITVPASELLGLRKGDRVFVQGTAIWDEAVNILRVEASKVFIAR